MQPTNAAEPAPPLPAWQVVLRALREARGITQDGWAARLEYSTRTVQRWERGLTLPDGKAEAALLALLQDEGLFRSFTAGPLRGIALTAVGLQQMLAEARSGKRTTAGTPADTSLARPAGTLLDVQLHNLPAQLTRFIGREAELTAAERLLAGHRLLTLTGPGGIGKTRLALALAARVADRFAGGAWFVDLTPVPDAAFVPLAVAQALGVREAEGQAPAEALRAALRASHLLLALDNLEHLLDAGPYLRDLLGAAPGLSILVTSRSVLHLPGEQQFAVPPLASPAEGTELVELEQNPAAALFMERAREVRPAFAITAENAAAVAGVCRRLEGLPLALELAAARVNVLPPQQMLGRLDQQLPLLTGGSRTAPVRQRTLRDTIRWSYDLLSKDERRLFRALSVFAGGCTLEAAEAVCVQAGAPDLLDGLASLVDKSLVRERHGPDGAASFGMLVALREFGREQAAAGGELAALEERHAAWVVALAEALLPRLETGGRDPWLDRLSAEQDNVRAALGWALREGRCEPGLRILAALSVWYWLRSAAEGRRWLAQLLACTATPVKAVVRARAEFVAGYVAFAAGNLAEAAAHFQESVELWQEVGDKRELGTALAWMGAVRAVGLEDAAPLVEAEQGVALLRQAGDPWRLAFGLFMLAAGRSITGRPAEGRPLPEESAAIMARLGDRWLGSVALMIAGAAATLLGDFAAAHAALDAAVPALRAQGQMADVVLVLGWRGLLFYREGDHARALRDSREALSVSLNTGAEGWTPGHITACACALAGAGEHSRAVKLLAGRAPDAVMPPLVQLALETARTALGDEAFAAAWTAGQRLSLDERIAPALASTAPLD